MWCVEESVGRVIRRRQNMCYVQVRVYGEREGVNFFEDCAGGRCVSDGGREGVLGAFAAGSGAGGGIGFLFCQSQWREERRKQNSGGAASE